MDGQREHGSSDKRKLSQRTIQRETHLVRCKSNCECFIRTEHQTPTWCPLVSKELPHYVSLTRLENQRATILEVRYPVYILQHIHESDSRIRLLNCVPGQCQSVRGSTVPTRLSEGLALFFWHSAHMCRRIRVARVCTSDQQTCWSSAHTLR